MVIIMLKFGAVTIDVSHPRAFAKELSKGDRAAYTAVFNDGFRTDEEVKAFADEFGLTIYNDLDEMIDNIDLGLVHSCNWDKHLDYIMHFVNKGKPVFVDKPIVGNLADCRKIIDLVTNGAVILGTSALRYCYEVQNTTSKMAELGSRPLHIHTTVGVDEYNYAIHAVELICGLNAAIPVSCRWVGNAQINGEGEKVDTYFITFDNGSTASYSNLGKKFALCNTSVLTDKGSDFCFAVDNTKLYEAMLTKVCDAMEGNKDALISVPVMVESVKVLLACKASKLNGGAEVRLDSPVLEEVSFDGNLFEESYAAAAHAAMKK